MKCKLGIFVCLITAGLLCGCSDNQQQSQIGESVSNNSVVISDENSDYDINSDTKNEIANTDKLIFDESVINIPDVSEAHSLIFKRRDWTKTELSNEFKECVNIFSDAHDINHIENNDLSYSYIDSLDGERGDKIERNFYSIYNESNAISAIYNHYSCFFRIYSKRADLSSLSYNLMPYFSDNTNEPLIQDANSLIENTTDAYKNFFGISEFELFPFSYNINDNVKCFKYGVSYKGISLDTNYYASMDSDILDVHMGNNYAEITVDNNEKLISLLSYYNWEVQEENTYTELFSLEEACNIVDSNISNNVVFEVSRVDLLYKINEVLDDDEQVLNWYGKPCWKFTIDASGIGEYQRIAFFVDAVTGEFSTYEIVM
ncbi:MAG: hypothetical protein NC320_12700 [Clostridium sp.]|nr:hypothetical protein [Clostridium sp.]